MTSTLAPEPKTTDRALRPLPARPAGLKPADRILDGPPALLVEHVTKRFVVGRGKPPVIAIDDVSLPPGARRRSTASWAPTAPASPR